MAGRGGNLTAREVAKLPPEEWPDRYRPASGKPASGRPARPYEEGNTASMTAGHRSPRVYGHVAAALAQGILETRPDLGAYPEAVASWADAEARAALLRYDLDRVGMFDDAGEIRSGRVSALDRFEKRAASERAKLGLDPRAEAELALLRAKAIELGHLEETPRPAVAAIAEAGRAALLDDAFAKARQRPTDSSVSASSDSGGQRHAERPGSSLNGSQSLSPSEGKG